MILIVFYLWKDIWRQWLTNPISILARVAISSFLFAFAIGLGLYFSSVEESVTEELESMGLNRILLTQYVYGDQLGELGGRLEGRFEGLRDDGAFAYLRRLPQKAEVEIVGDAQVVTYRDSDLFSLRKFIPQMDGMDPYLITAEELPEGSRISAWLKGVDLQVEIIDSKSLRFREFTDQTYLLIPSDWVNWLEEGGYAEMVFFESRAHDISSVRGLVETVQAMLRLDGLSNVSMRSGIAILERLEALRGQQRMWSILIRLVVSLLIVLIFASTTFLEYRQNIYLSALLQSLGVSKFFIFFRYLLEQAILLFFGLTLAIGAIWLVFNQMDSMADTLTYLKLVQIQPFAVYQEWTFELILTAFISLLPILIGLRKDVGKILQ